MPISIEWDNPEQTIIRVCFNGKWNTDELQNMIRQGRGMSKSVSHPVDSIFDFSQSLSSPTSALAVIQNLDLDRPQNERLLIVVKASSYIKTMCNIARKLSPRTFVNLLFVETMNDAYKATELPFAMVK